jgi:hypothetical protein
MRGREAKRLGLGIVLDVDPDAGFRHGGAPAAPALLRPAGVSIAAVVGQFRADAMARPRAAPDGSGACVW